MSVRRSHKNQSAVIDDRMRQLVEQREFIDTEYHALEVAKEAVNAEPRHITNCNVCLEYAPRQGVFNWAECSECETTFPYMELFAWCPFCGSTIETVTREANAFDKLNRQVTARAIESLT